MPDMPTFVRRRSAGPAAALAAALAIGFAFPSGLPAGDALDSIRAEITRRHDEDVRRLQD